MKYLRSLMVGCAVLACVPVIGLGDGQIQDAEFSLHYGARGITSLKRVHDAFDTDYISPNGALGSLAVQYRAAGDKDWTMVRDIAPVDGAEAAKSGPIRYTLGTLMQSLSQTSKVTASPGATNLSAINDGRFPAAGMPAGGRRRGGGGGQGGAGAGNPMVACTWPAGGGSVWAEYTFATEQTVSTARVSWQPQGPGIQLPASWRLLYAVGNDWKEVEGASAYGLSTDGMNEVHFQPVKTTAFRLEMAPAGSAGVGLYEWQVGPERTVSPPKDLTVDESFKLDDHGLNWTVTLANQGTAALEIGDVALPLDMAEGTPPGRQDIYSHKLLRHSFIAGNGSWVYWQRANNVGPFLVMVPQGNAGFEYSGEVTGNGDNGATPGAAFGGRTIGGPFTAFVHAAASSAAPIAAGKAAGREQPWRLPITSQTLAPKGSAGTR